MEVLLNSSSGATLLTLFLFYFSAVSILVYMITVGKRRVGRIKVKLICFAFLLAGIIVDIINFSICKTLYGATCYQPRHLFAKLLLYSSVFIIFYLRSAGFLGGRYNVYRFVAGIWFPPLLLDMLSLYCFHSTGHIYMLSLSLLFIFLVAVAMGFSAVVILKRYDILVRCLHRDNIIYAFTFVGIAFFFSFMLFLLIAGDDAPKEWHLLFLIIPVSLHFLYLSYRGGAGVPEKRVKPYKFSKDEERFSGLVGDLPSDEYVIIQRLISYFESEKPFLDKNLKLDDVSRYLYTNKTYLSRALNRKMYKNFNQFVNRYRVVEACNIYIDNRDLNINELCDMSGFKNISSFCAAFNLNTGYTPAEWCKEVKKRLDNGENVAIEKYFI